MYRTDFNEPNPNRIWRHSLVACLAALALFGATITVDVAVFRGTIMLPRWLSVGGPDDARVIISALLSSVSTVLALMFTVIMLVLSLAATWFGPRLMSRFIRQSRLAAWIMGLFLASFVQCVLALIAIREWEHAVWVPQLTLLMIIALVVTDFFALVYFCHRIAEAIQISNVLTVVVNDIRRVIREVPAAAVIDPTAGCVVATGATPPIPQDAIEAQSALCERNGLPVRATRSGYLQKIEHIPLFTAADRAGAVVCLLFRRGQFVTRGSLLAYVHPAERGEELAEAVDRHHVLGRERTLKQDLEFGMAQLVEIALRALSAAINDVYTGIYCVDWLGEVLLELASVRPLDGAWTTESGTIRLLEPPLSFRRLVKAGFNQIRQVAPGNVALTIRLFQTFARLISQLTDEGHRQAVEAQVEALWEMASSAPMARVDHDDVEEAYERARSAGSRHASVAQAGTVVPISAVPLPCQPAPARHPTDALDA